MKTLPIAYWIQARRIEKNMTLGHLAEKMGIARTLVRALEEGSKEPDQKHLEIMAKIFGIDAGAKTGAGDFR
jgi:transcriptional regulator with XRE-family HTH domain